MKKLFSVLALAIIFTACKTKTDANKEMVGTSASGLNNGTVTSDTSRTTKVRVLPNGTTTTTTVTTVGKPEREIEHERNTHKIESVHSNGTSIKKSTSTTTTNSDVNTAPATNQKKGWSQAAVGATMGGVSGAALGAIVSKNKAEGAIIGGVVGAGTGYAIGRASDRKSGRVKKKVVTTTTNN